MSGHSKWSKIKRKKGAKDAERGAIFTKLSKIITIAASEGGGDPDMNFNLRLAIDNAKNENMPSAKIDRAIKKGTGELDDGARIEKIIYEGTGPGGTFFIVSCSTDNSNRTVADLRKIFEERGGSLGTSGSAMWQFDEKGVIIIKSEKITKSEKFGEEDVFVEIDVEELELELFEIDGIEDVIVDKEDNEIEIVTEKNSFSSVHKHLVADNIHIIEANLQYVPKSEVQLQENNKEKNTNLMEELSDHDDVDNVFVNFDM